MSPSLQELHRAIEKAAAGKHASRGCFNALFSAREERLKAREKRWALVKARQSAEAKRDASLIFAAASEGRPLELARRLRLGHLANGITMQGVITAEDGTPTRVGPLEAARLGGHSECVELLEKAAVVATAVSDKRTKYFADKAALEELRYSDPIAYYGNGVLVD